MARSVQHPNTVVTDCKGVIVPRDVQPLSRYVGLRLDRLGCARVPAKGPCDYALTLCVCATGSSAGSAFGGVCGTCLNIKLVDICFRVGVKFAAVFHQLLTSKLPTKHSSRDTPDKQVTKEQDETQQ